MPTIKLKRSATQNAVPTTSQLGLGEVALNTYDGKMFIKKSVGGTESIVEIGGDATSSSGIDFTGNLNLADDVRIVIGDGNDLQIYHDGSDSYITDGGTGNLKIQADDLVFKTADGSKEYLKGTASGSVRIRHNNSTKFETTSTGATVTGTLVADGLDLGDDNILNVGTIAVDKVKGDADDNTNITFAGNDVTAFYQGGAEKIRIDADGRLLVNTTSSVDNFAKIQVVGDSSSLARITLQDVDGTNQKTYFEQSNGGTRINTQDGTSHGFFTIGGWNGTSSSDFLRVTSLGRVGIGTVNPEHPLHVSFSGDNGAQIKSTDNHASLYINAGSGYGSYIRFEENNAQNYWINADTNGRLLFRPAGGSSNWITFDSSGRVGIGITSPSTPLAVQSNSSAQGITILGRSSDDISQLDFVENDGTSIGGFQARTTDFRIRSVQNLPLLFMTNNTERVRIHSGGQLGIGVTDFTNALRGTGKQLIIGSCFVGTGAALVADDFARFGGALYIHEDAGSNSANLTSLDNNGDRLVITGKGGTTNNALDAPDGFYVGGTQFITSSRQITNVTSITATGAISTTGTASLGAINVGSSTSGNVFFKRPNANYIFADQSGGYLVFGTNGRSTSVANSNFYLGTNQDVIFQGSISVASNVTSSGLFTSSQNQQGFRHIAPDVMSGHTSRNEMTFSWTADETRWYMFPTVDGSSNFGRELSFDYSSEEWSIEGPVTLSSLSTGNITTTGYLRGPSTFTIDPATHGDDTGTVVIAGNLQVDGTTTTINSTTLTVDDKNITLASGASNAAAANGAGITVDCGSDTDATLTYLSGPDKWQFNKELVVQEGSSAIAFNEYSNGATIWLDGSDGDFTGGDYFNISAFGTTDLAFGYGAATKITMKNDGKLGIGITDPATNLHISSTSTSTLTIQNSTNAGSASLHFRDESNVDQYKVLYDLPNNRAEQHFNGNGLRFYSNQISAEVAKIGFGNGYNSSYFAGRVGIGLSSPTYKLDVSAGSAIAARFTGGDSNGITSIFTRPSEQGLKTWSGNSYYSGLVAGAHFQIFTNNSSGTPRVTVLDTGNVGIGTTSPSAKLHVTDTVFIDYPDGSGTSLKIGRNDSSNYWEVGHAGGDFRLYNTAGSGSDILFGVQNGGVDQGNKVGIGTATPDKKLTVDGDVKVGNGDAFMSANVAGSTRSLISLGTDNILRIKGNDPEGSGNVISMINGGRVGIGTTAPAADLDIAGTLAAPPTLRLSNTTTAFTQGDNVGQIEFYHADPTDFTPGAFGIIRGVAGASGGEGSIQVLTNMPSEGTDANDVAIEFTGAGAVKISDAFTLPTSDGSGNQVLQTDGSGNVSWATISGVGTATEIADADGDTRIQTEESSDEDKIRFDVAGTQKAVIDSSNFTVTSGGFRVDDPGNNYPFRVTGYGYLTTRSASIAQLNGTDHANVPLSVLADVNTTRTASYVEIGDIGSAGNRFKIDNTGRVGIGTNAPSAPLHVVGADSGIKISSDASDRPHLSLVNGTSEMLRLSANNLYGAIGDSTDSQRYMTFVNGSIGIGTTNPGAKVAIVKSTNATNGVIIQNGTTGTAARSNLRLLSDAAQLDIYATSSTYSGVSSWADAGVISTSSNASGGLIFNAQATGHIFQTGTNERMRINSSGYVGIGTTSPSQKLQVAGTILADTALAASSGNDAIGIGSESNITDTSSTYRIKLLSDSNNAKLTTYAYSSYLTLKAGVDGTNYANNWSKIELRDGGGVGANNAHMKFYTHGDERMIIDNGGNVGIGTTSPSAPLHLKGTGDTTLIVEADSDNTGEADNARIELRQDGNNVAGYLYTEGNAGQTATGTLANTTVLESKASGNDVGIHFATGGRAPAQSGGELAGTVRMTVHGSGGVSIGTTTAASNGGLLVDNDIKGNSRIGVGSGGNLSDAAIYKNSDTNTGIIWPAADTLAFTTGGGERVRINGNGVGIGEASIDANLHITHTNPNLKFEIAGQGKWAIGMPAGQTYLAFDETNDALSTPTMVLTKTTKRVGIGTTSPNVELDLRGNMRLDGSAGTDRQIYFRNQGTGGGSVRSDKNLSLWAGNGSGSLVQYVTIEEGGRVGIGTTNPAKYLHLQYSSSATAVHTGDGLSGGADGGGALIQNTNTSGNTFANLDFRARDADGRIAYQYAGATNNGDFHFITDNLGSPRSQFIIRNNGKVEFDQHNTSLNGTANGATLAEFKNYIGADLNQQKSFLDFIFSDDNSNETPQVRIGAEVGQNGNADSQEKEGSGAFVVYTNNADTTSGDAGASLAERFRVDYAGNVGIGTATPGARLEIKGTTTDNSAEALNVRDSSNNQLFRVRNDGVVIIGDNYLYVTSSAGAYFDGSVRFRNGITDDTGQLSLNSSTADITFNSCDLESVGNITTSGYLRGPSTFTIDPATHGDNTGTVVIAGNLQVDGTTTTINSTTLTVDDKNITLASGSSNAAAANGAGITVDCGSNTDATFTYDGTNDEWDFNKNINVTGAVVSSANGAITTASGTTARFSVSETGGATTAMDARGSTGNIGTRSNHTLGFLVNDVQKATLTANGDFSVTNDIKVTTTNPRIDFDGGNSGALRFFSTSAAEERMRITSAGNVGIGTTSPDQKLSIKGRVSSDLGDSYYGAWFEGNSATNGYSFFSVGPWYNGAGYFQRKQGQNYSHIYEYNANHNIIIQAGSGANGETSGGGRVGIGTTSPQAKLQIEEAGIDTTTTSTTATTQVAIDTFAAATFRSARYTIQVTNGTDSTYHLTEILLIHDGTTPQITEYGTIFTGSAEATFDADISSGNVRLLATPATTDSMTFKVVRHCITV